MEGIRTSPEATPSNLQSSPVSARSVVKARRFMSLHTALPPVFPMCTCFLEHQAFLDTVGHPLFRIKGLQNSGKILTSCQQVEVENFLVINDALVACTVRNVKAISQHHVPPGAKVCWFICSFSSKNWCMKSPSTAAAACTISTT